MSKEGVSFKNRDRFIQLGIAISTLRKLRGMSQDQLAEKANMSRSHLSAIEAPNMIRSFSLETLFNLADALMITPSDLLNTSLFSEQINDLTDSEKYGVDGCDCEETLRLIAEGKIDTEPLITHTYLLRRIAEGYELFEKKRDGVIKVAVEC